MLQHEAFIDLDGGIKEFSGEEFVGAWAAKARVADVDIVKSEIGWIRDPFIMTESGTEFPTESVFRAHGGVDQAGTEVIDGCWVARALRFVHIVRLREIRKGRNHAALAAQFTERQV